MHPKVRTFKILRNKRTMKLGCKFTRRWSSSHNKKCQQSTFFSFRDGWQGGHFEHINNVIPNGPGVLELFQKEDALVRIVRRFANAVNAKGIGLDPDSNDKFVVREFEGFLIGTFAYDCFGDGIDAPSLGVQVLTVWT